MSDPSIFIVDDDEAVRDSIAELVASVGLHAVGFASAQQFLDAFDPHRPGCLVLDVRMANMSGPELQDKLIEIGARIPIVFISGHADIPVAVKSIKAGAVDFVQKPYREQQLLDSINAALRLDAAARATNGVHVAFARREAMLTEREREVMELVVKGLSSKAVAKTLSISYRTVELHRSHILDKLGVRSVAELIRVIVERRAT